MSSFKDMVKADNSGVFLNLNEFAESRTVIYDGETYEDIPVVMSGLKEKDRKRSVISDHAQGLFSVSSILHLKASDLGGHQPEKGQKIKINDEEGGKYFRHFYVASSVCELGMLRIELEAIDE